MLYDKSMVIKFCDVLDSTVVISLLDHLGSLAYGFHELNALISHLVDERETSHIRTLFQILSDIYAAVCPLEMEEKYFVTLRREVLSMSTSW